MKLVVKFSPEITIKSRPVRKRFSQKLANNIKKVLTARDLPADVVLRWDMIELQIDRTHQELEEHFVQRCNRVKSELANIPGVAHFLEAKEYSFVDKSEDFDESVGDDYLEKIANAVAADWVSKLEGKSFVVRAKRAGKHGFNSHQLERYVGAALNASVESAKVKMKNADHEINIEVKRERFFVVVDRVAGLGGYPLGTVGPVLSLISGGFDSCVASYQTIRRGMETHYCFFNLGGKAHEVGVAQVAHFLWDKYSLSHRVGFISVDFAPVVEEILEKVDHSYWGVVLKRMMMRAAAEVAKEMKIEALVTGESIAQVSSQTLRNLSVIDSVTDMLTIRPLLTSDKTEIIAEATKIEVAGFAEAMPEYCAVISQKPSTSVNPEKLLEQEQQFDFSILNRVVCERKRTGIDHVFQEQVGFDDVAKISVPNTQAIIIDVRHSSDQERAPLVLHGNEIISIPYYQVNQTFADLAQDKRYLLYCDKGVMSMMHAAHLRAEGFNNVDVYAPDAN